MTRFLIEVPHEGTRRAVYRSQANIVQLNAFTTRDLEDLVSDHGT